MSEIQESSLKSGLNILEKSFQDYKSKLERAEQEANEIVDLAWQKAETIIANKQEEVQQIADDIQQKARQESERIILEAKDRAAEIMRDVNDKSRKEAKEKTKREAERIITETREIAEKQSTEILDLARREAEKILQETRNSAQIQVLQESENIIAEAKENAKRVDKDSIKRAEETNKLILEVLQKAESIVGRFKTEVQAELAALVVAFSKERESIETKAVLDNNIDSSNHNKRNGDNHPLNGRRELNIIMPYDAIQVRKLVELLKKIPGIKLDGEAATEENFTIYLDITEPVPLHNILQELPLVESFDGRGDMIELRLKQSNNGG